MNQMEWYAAHTLTAYQRTDGTGVVSVFENIYLVRAESSESGWEKATQLSDLESQDDDETMIDGLPAKCIYSGVRKLVTICNESPPQYQTGPIDGSEISYIAYEVNNLKELEEILSGNSGVINLID